MPVTQCGCGVWVDDHPNARRAHWAGAAHRTGLQKAVERHSSLPPVALCIGRPRDGTCKVVNPVMMQLDKACSSQDGKSRYAKPPKASRLGKVPSATPDPTAQVRKKSARAGKAGPKPTPTPKDLPETDTGQPASSSGLGSFDGELQGTALAEVPAPPSLEATENPSLAAEKRRLERMVLDLNQTVEGLQRGSAEMRAELDRQRRAREADGRPEGPPVWRMEQRPAESAVAALAQNYTDLQRQWRNGERGAAVAEPVLGGKPALERAVASLTSTVEDLKRETVEMREELERQRRESEESEEARSAELHSWCSQIETELQEALQGWATPELPLPLGPRDALQNPRLVRARRRPAPASDGNTGSLVPYSNEGCVAVSTALVPVPCRILRPYDFPHVPVTLGFLVAVKQAFEAADVDRAGCLDVAALGRYCAQKGLPAVGFGQLMKMIDAADPQRTGTVDFFGFFGIQVYMVLKLKTRHVVLREWMKFCVEGDLTEAELLLEDVEATPTRSTPADSPRGAGSGLGLDRRPSRLRHALTQHIADAAHVQQAQLDEPGLSSSASTS